jgi:hypothetical protein
VTLSILKENKEHFVQQAQFLLSNHRVVSPWCTQVLAFIELPMDNENSRAFKVSLAKHQFVRKNLWQKILRHQKTGTFFNI